MTTKQLIFIVSQPRSGSTFLQNLLSNNPRTNTTSEMWLLLNFFNFYKPELYRTKFDNNLSSDAFKNYLSKYPDFEFEKKYKKFLLDLYQPLFSQEFEYVIDKTPRYWEILDEMIKVFPESKIIILKRNPMDVLKSIITTRNKSIHGLNYSRRDILIAPRKIHTFCEDHKENSNVYVLRYEDLIRDTKKEIRNIYKWIGVKYDDSVLNTKNNLKYKGKYGDPYQNSELGYDLAKRKMRNKISQSFEKLISGYEYYLGNEFLEKYGGYKTNSQKQTIAFRYFLNLGCKDENNNSLSLRQKLRMYLLRPFIKY